MPTPSWLSPLVWTDYRLALVFTVVLPLVLLIWAFVAKAEAIQKLLGIYWRVASLLAFTIYLLIGALPIGFISSWLARILIPLSLWFWADLNEEIAEQRRSPLKLVFSAWRWAVSVYCVLGALAQIPVLQCAFKSHNDLLANPLCRVWLEAPWGFRELFHSTTRPWFLAGVGMVGLIVYVLYLSHFVLFRLGKQGRSATGQ